MNHLKRIELKIINFKNKIKSNFHIKKVNNKMVKNKKKKKKRKKIVIIFF